MIEFYTVKESLYSEEAGSFTAYGIGVCENDQCKKKILEYIPNIFLDKQKAEQLVAKCNRLQLDPLHLFNVVEDAVLDF